MIGLSHEVTKIDTSEICFQRNDTFDDLFSKKRCISHTFRRPKQHDTDKTTSQIGRVREQIFATNVLAPVCLDWPIITVSIEVLFIELIMRKEIVATVGTYWWGR